MVCFIVYNNFQMVIFWQLVMVLISGLIASSYRRSYVTRLGARAARDGAERRSTEDGPAVVCYQGIQYFSDPGGDGRASFCYHGNSPNYQGNSGLPSYGSAFTRNGRQGTYFINRLWDF